MSSSLAPSLSKPACRPDATRGHTLRAWRDVLLPREHGSWSLAFEPVALGLIAAPSRAGAWFALAVAAGFFARRPLRLVARETNAARVAVARGAVLACATAAVLATVAAMGSAGTGWLPWLVPTAVAGAIFLHYDRRNEGREAAAEASGAAAFGFLPAVFAILHGDAARGALTLAFVMLARAVPTVMTVRVSLRRTKSGTGNASAPLAASLAVLATGVGLNLAGRFPLAWVVLLALLAIRTVLVLACAPTTLRARTLGVGEAIVGMIFVVTAGLTAR